MAKPIFSTPSGVSAITLRLDEYFYENPHTRNPNTKTQDSRFVPSNWRQIADWAHFYRQLSGTNGVLVAHHPTPKDEHVEHMGNAPVGITYMTPREIVKHCDTDKESVLYLLNDIASYDYKREALVLVIYGNGEAEYATYDYRPSPRRATAPVSLD